MPENNQKIETGRATDYYLRRAIPYLITLIAGIICYGLFYKRGIWLSVVGYSIAPAERVLNGEVPYRDFLFNYTPGVLWLNALLMKCFGVELLPIHIGILVFKLITIFTLYSVTRKLTDRWVALIPVVLTLAWLGHKHIFNVHPTQYSLSFALFGLYMMLTYYESNKKRNLIISGIMVGVVFIFKYNVGLLLTITVSTAIILSEYIRSSNIQSWPFLKCILTRLTLFIGGTVSMVSVALFYLSVKGALAPMVDHFLHYAAEYSEERAIGLPGARMLVPVVSFLALAVLIGLLIRRLMPAGFIVYTFALIGALFFLILGPGAIVFKESVTSAMSYIPAIVLLDAAVLIGYQGYKLKRPSKVVDVDPLREGKVLIVLMFVLGTYLEVFPRADYYHLVRVLPPVFLLIILLIYNGGIRIRRLKPEMFGLYLAVSCLPLVFLLLTGIKDTWRPQFENGFHFNDDTPINVERARGILVNKELAMLIEDVTRYIDQNSGPGDPVFSFARRGGGLSFLAGRRNTSRIIWWDSSGIKREDKDAVISMLEGKRAKLVLIQEKLDDKLVLECVERKYEIIGIVSDIKVFRIKNAE